MEIYKIYKNGKNSSYPTNIERKVVTTQLQQCQDTYPYSALMLYYQLRKMFFISLIIPSLLYVTLPFRNFYSISLSSMAVFLILIFFFPLSFISLFWLNFCLLPTLQILLPTFVVSSSQCNFKFGDHV